jgi:hypothetical protein
MRKLALRALLPLALLALSALAVPASAADGVVKGRLRFYNNQGNYCPTDRDCTGARYLQADYNVYLPIRDVKVYAVASDGAVLGSGTTDANGNYTISWFAWTLATSVTGSVEWYGEHKDGRFSLRNASGGRYVFWTSNVTLRSGTTSRSPQDLGTRTWGSATAPHALANLYDGALRTWRDSLSASSRMVADFTNVEIWAFDDDPCDTSCANGGLKRVTIDSTGSAFTPQARIMHELGHIASHLAKPRTACSDYGRDGGDSWNQTSAEWACASFEEGLATFFGDRAVYWASSPQPSTCNSAGTCSLSNRSTEASTGTSCVSGENRWALTVNRYLRDLYDTRNEAQDTNSASFATFFDTLDRFGGGVGNRDVNEPWADFLMALDDLDGRSARDFRSHFESLTGADTASNFVNNCTPVGD